MAARPAIRAPLFLLCTLVTGVAATACELLVQLDPGAAVPDGGLDSSCPICSDVSAPDDAADGEPPSAEAGRDAGGEDARADSPTSDAGAGD
jgi:hypothetical protein